MELKMSNKNQQVNYRALIGAGVAFMGAGIAFIAAVNTAIGAGLFTVGIMFVAIGAIKTRSKNDQ
jgi:hypothetical protein